MIAAAVSSQLLSMPNIVEEGFIVDSMLMLKVTFGLVEKTRFKITEVLIENAINTRFLFECGGSFDP